jgi:hypothetical protein
MPLQSPPMEIIKVGGLRGAMSRSLNENKNTTAITDGIAAVDFGVLPGLSVSNLIENISAATGHRLKGSQNEISIRGLGSYWGYSTFNGRNIINAGPSRAVNFKKCPSELVDKRVIDKSQQANLVEGGTSGTIDVSSLKPVDFGKSQTTVEASGVCHSYDDKAAHQALTSGIIDNCINDHYNGNLFEDAGGGSGQFATYDSECFIGQMLGQIPSHYRDTSFYEIGERVDGRSGSDVDLTKDILAAYIMADINSEVAGLPVFGHVGVRMVKTKTHSDSWGDKIYITTNDDGTFSADIKVTGKIEAVNLDSSYTEYRPSLNTFVLAPEWYLGVATYKAISRFQMHAMSSGVEYSLCDEGDNGDYELSTNTDLGRVIANVSASGNHTDPNLSNNYDISLEWYPSKNAAVSLTYNYADSTFVTAELGSPEIVSDANLFGFSPQVASASIYWEGDWAKLHLLYKHRESDFQPNGLPFPDRSNRYVQDNDHLDFWANVTVTDYLSVSLKALDLLNEPQIMMRGNNTTVADYSRSGANYFLSAKVKFYPTAPQPHLMPLRGYY